MVRIARWCLGGASAQEYEEVTELSGTLIIAEHVQGRLSATTAELVTAARELSFPVEVVVIGGNAAALAGEVALSGVSKVLLVETAPAEFDGDYYRNALEFLIAQRSPEVVLLGFTINAMSYGPPVAAKLGLGFASDVFAMKRSDGELTVTRSYYAGKVDAELTLGPSPAIVMLRPTAWVPVLESAEVPVETVEIPAVSSHTRHRGFVELPRAEIDITKAEFLLSIGRGVGERENVALFEELASKMSATLCGSRPLVDAGWLSSARQVGQSGNTVSPKVYLAFGISGAVQHLVGMKSSGTIIAVNTDPEAAIFSVAHYGAVLDMFDVVEELEKLY